MLLDEDPRVQANAVEALWTFDPAEARPLLLNAARSKTPRVAGNAAVGLYRIGDLSSLRLLFNGAGRGIRLPHERGLGDGRNRRSAFPSLSNALGSQQQRQRKGEVIQALGRITAARKIACRSRRPSRYAVGMPRGTAPAAHVILSLWSPEKPDLSALKPTQFAIWEGGALVRITRSPRSRMRLWLISGFVLPRFSSVVGPYAIAVLDAIERCLKYKRVDDLWRLDRYLSEPRTGESGAPLEKAALPYDESLSGPMRRPSSVVFWPPPKCFGKLSESPGPRERATDDASPRSIAKATP